METDTRIVRFGEYALDPSTIEIRKHGEPVKVEPQVFDVLTYLVTHRDRVVPKTELLDNVWGDRFVSESALTSRIKSARQAVGDDGRRQSMIRTAHGRGYQFVAAVEADEPAPEPRAAERSAGEPASERRAAGPSAGEPAPQPTGTSTGGLFGRDRELAALQQLLSDHQLVTVLGPGGVGKTRLAAEVSYWWEDLGHRSAFVALDGVSDPALLVPAICDAFAVRSEAEADLLAMLRETVRDEPALVVLDNFEQLAGAAAEVAALVGSLPELRVLVTSRNRLQLSIEHTFDLDPLDVDDKADQDADLAPACQLFVQAARNAQPDFEATDDNRIEITGICRLVDGLPLAIELAAAQLRYMPVDYLHSHLRTNLISIGQELADRPTRQHSIAALIGWSHALLTPAQQRLLARLSVFAGGWPILGARIVGRFDSDLDAFSGVAGLVDKSLVKSDPHAGSPRFTMLNLIRAFARDRNAGSEILIDAENDHAVFVTTAVRSIEESRWGPRAGHWIDDLNTEYANITAALERSAANGAAESAGRIVADLNIWWYRSGRHVAGRRWIAEVLPHADGLDAETTGRIEFAAGFMAFTDRDLDRSRAHYERAIAAADQAGDWRYSQLSRCGLSGTSMGDPDEYDTALERLEQVVVEASQRDEQSVLAHALNVTGVFLRRAGDPDGARERYIAALEHNRHIGDRYQEAMNLINLGLLAASEGNSKDALAHSRDALHLSWRIGSQLLSAWILASTAQFQQLDGNAELASRLLGAADALLDAFGAHRGPAADQRLYDRTVENLQAALGADRFDLLRAEGREIKFESAVELALDR